MTHLSDEPLQADLHDEELQSPSPTDEAAGTEVSADRKDWQLWPPSPKMQIVLIAMVFGAFNLILLAIWALVMVYRF